MAKTSLPGLILAFVSVLVLCVCCFGFVFLIKSSINVSDEVISPLFPSRLLVT